MRQVLLKFAVLLVAIFCLSIVHGGAIAGEEAEEPEQPTGAATPTIKGPEFSGFPLTTGFFVSDLHDKSYVARDEKIARGIDDDYSISPGILAHVPFALQADCYGFHTALGLSGGVGITNLAALNKNAQFTLGVSLLFKSETHTLAFTFGGIIRPVKRLSGYDVGDKFPANGTEITERVYKQGYFFSITTSVDFPSLFGSNKEREVKTEDTPGARDASETRDTSDTGNSTNN